MAGQSFMIYSRDLPRSYVYLEFASGLIQVAEAVSGAHDFVIIRDLDWREASDLRDLYQLD